MKKVICFLLFGLILFFNSCKNSSVKFEKNFTFERNNWIRFKTVNFDFDIEDTASFYDVSLTVRHNKDYPNSNLLTYIYITYPNGEKRYLESNIKIICLPKEIIKLKSAILCQNMIIPELYKSV